MAPPRKRSRWNLVAAEGALVLVVVFLLAVAATAGFVVGRDSVAEDDAPAAAETATGPTAVETETETAEPTVTTETETQAGEDVDGAAVFAEAGCGGCHRFEPAGSTGTVGPPLDGIDRSKDEIAQQVRTGGRGMPPFEGRLTDEQIEAVADYVENAG